MGLLSTIGSFFGPVGTAVGAVGDYALGKDDASDANSANADQAREARDWQTNMRGTAYQATVKDLQAAGLNPMLAYSNGATQTPGAAVSAPMQNKGLQSTQQSLNSAQSANQTAQLENVRAQTGLIKAQEAKTLNEIPQITTSTTNMAQQTENLKTVLQKTQAEIEQVRQATKTGYQQELTQVQSRNLMQAQQELAEIDNKLRSYQISNTEAETKFKTIVTHLQQLAVPGAQNEADFEKGISGELSPYGRAIKSILQAVRSVIK